MAARPGLLGLAGLLIHLITHENDDVPWQMAAAAFLFFGAIAAALTLEPEPVEGAGAVRAGGRRGHGRARVARGAVRREPARRAVRLRRRAWWRARWRCRCSRRTSSRRGWPTPYRRDLRPRVDRRDQRGGALAFTGISWVVLALLSELFQLLKIGFLRELMNQAWFGWTLLGPRRGRGARHDPQPAQGAGDDADGGAAGRLAAGGAAGVGADGVPRWRPPCRARKCCGTRRAARRRCCWPARRGRAVLASVIARDAGRGDDPLAGHARRGDWCWQRWSLPLAVFAAVSMGLRLGQYGLAPERLWGLVAIVVALRVRTGLLGRAGARAQGRLGGEDPRDQLPPRAVRVRLALLLALPILDFGAISTRNQVARLESGRVKRGGFRLRRLALGFRRAGPACAARSWRRAGGDVAEGARARSRAHERGGRGLRDRQGPSAKSALRVCVQPDNR